MALTFRLDNGLTVVFEEQHSAKVAAFQVWVKAGSADERPDQAGLAHLHEHMLFKGTKSRGPGEMAKALESLGGEVNAWTSFDQTVYHVVMASRFAEAGLAILADAVRNPAFDEGELAREIEVVCEEIKRSEDSPSRRSSRLLFSTAYRAHPYQRPVLGSEETVRSFTREKTLEFYERHYIPDNMVLAACGDLSPEQLSTWAEKTLGGSWGRTYEGPVRREVEPLFTGPRSRVQTDDVKEVYLSLAFPIPQAEHEHTPGLDVLGMLLGQGDASRLSMEVKRRRSLVSGIHAYAYTPKDPGLFILSLTCPLKTLPSALEEGVHALLQARDLVPPKDELDTIKAQMEAEAIYQRETVQGLARKMGFYQSSFGSLAAEARYYDAISRVTPKELCELATRYLDLSRSALTALIPREAGDLAEELQHCLTRAKGRPLGALAPRSTAKVVPFEPSAITKGSVERPKDLIVEKLASGATLVIREEKSVPLFAMRAAFLGGLRYEVDANNGLTALLCRSWTRGTKDYDAEQVSRAVDEMAGSLSAAGGRNTVGLRAEFLSRHFDRAFSLFTECLLQPAFPEGELQRERSLLLQDIHTRDDKPSGLAFELFTRTLYTKHPYRMPVLGEQASVERLDRAALEAYRKSYLNVGQLTLCVVGDVRAEEVVLRANQALGKKAGEFREPPPVPDEPALGGARTAKRTLARAQTHLVLGFLGLTVSSKKRHALEVLSTVLSGQGGRLFLELRDKRSLAYSVASYSVEGLERGYFAVYMGTSPEKVDEALLGIRTELCRVRDEEVTPEELTRAKRHLLGTHEIGLQRNGARAALLAMDTLYGLGDENFRGYAEAVSKISARDVQEVARELIDFDRSALAIVGPNG
jgi:zinc protease